MSPLVYFVLAAAGFAAAYVYTYRVRKEGKSPRGQVPRLGSLDLYDTALLAGGLGRAVDVATVTLHARGIVHIDGAGRVTDLGAHPPTDPIAASVLDALRAQGGTASFTELRVAVAPSPTVLAVEQRLFALKLLNPGARGPRPRLARVILAAVTALTLAGLFVPGIAGSPTEHTVWWVVNLVLFLVGAVGCAGMAWWLFERYDKLEGPLPDHARMYLEQMAFYPQAGLANVAAAQPGGAGLARFALAGPEWVGDPALAAVLFEALRGGAGRIRSRGWTEDQWHRAANARTPLGGPGLIDPTPADQPPPTYGSPNGAAAHWSNGGYAPPPGPQPFDDPRE
ncbi:TIGR04222 domain-containing membrane protein [Embleya sp. AB8]|uniref:TIGR04222 domain-containing membrane protein n=1 Tax=Embleya sp. AB8 TaxID=3156304 RepID=UPI003C74D322